MLIVLVVSFGLIFVVRGVQGFRRGQIHYFVGGYSGWPFYRSDLLTRQQDGLLYWLVCASNLLLGLGIAGWGSWIIGSLPL
ncbi:MAG: hypothetical protein J0M24_13150 [Verrucomicrobia bacterium]|nr:hypothetical protein [Verrucomicrobiota bacterium]